MYTPLPPPKEREYLATMEQFASAQLVTMQEGAARGDRLVLVDNGSGLSFTVTPDRAMDIVECRYKGIPIAFRTANGYDSAAHFEPDGIRWLRNWPAGLLTTAGLRNAGNPNGVFGLHGRGGNTQADDFGIMRGLDEAGTYHLELRGTMRETCMMGENLRWQRTISTTYGENSITVADLVTNLAALPDYVQLLYHCNFGYPLVSPSLEFDVPLHPVRPRTPKAEANLARWHKMEIPTPDYEEECFFHDLPLDEKGRKHFAVQNREAGLRVDMDFSGEEFTNFVEWKNCVTGNYVLGLEPGNVSLAGRTEDIASGFARKIEPGESIAFDLKFTFSEAK